MALDRVGDFGRGDYPPRRTIIERIPPQNIEAEQAVLGAMLLGDRAAIEKATEMLSREDFYRDAHAHIFDAMVALTEKDEPVDAITLKDELIRRGFYDLIGGPTYLMALGDIVPSAANIAYYAKIVLEKAILRRLIEASSTISGLAYGEVEDVDTLVDQAERTIFEVSTKRSASFFFPLRPLLNEAFEKIDTLYHDKGVTTGVDTGFADLNYITSGLQDGDLIIIAARPSMGKCLTAHTLIDHPLTGERLTIEEFVQRKIPVVFGLSDTGRVRATTVEAWVDSGVKPCYRVTTRTGRQVEVTGHHPFLTVQGWMPLYDLHAGDCIGVPRAVPAFGTDETLPPDLVRLLGYFIAEGGLTGTCPKFTNTDPALIADFRAIIAEQFPTCVITQDRITYKVVRPTRSLWKSSANPVTVWLKELGLWGKLAEAKRFPDCVWRWTQAHLAAFLRVLMSCDGTIYAMQGYPRIEFAVASEPLARDVHHALARFGIVAKFWRKKDRCWRVEITEPESVAAYQKQIGWLGEKASRTFRELPIRRSNTGHAPRATWQRVRIAAAERGLSLAELARRSGEKVPLSGGYNPHANRGIPRYRLAACADVLNDETLRSLSSPDIYWDEIVTIEPIGEHQVYDLTVPDGANFIAQDVCVHNTALCLGIGQNAALRASKSVAVFSLEMSKEQLVQRMICSEAKVDAHRLRTGYLKDEDWTSIAEAVQRLWDANLFIDDTTDISALEMRAKCRRLRAEHGLDLVIVDYLQLMRGHGKGNENRNQEITEIARGLKGLARELKVPVIALSQLSRAVERREDKRPMLSDLRECVAGDTRVINADTGSLVPIRDVRRGDRILSCAKDQKIAPFVVEEVWSTGIKPVKTLTTRTGRRLTGTDNHPLLTATGWKTLGALRVGDVIATAMRLPEFGTEGAGQGDLCRLLGYLAGDGTCQWRRGVGFISADSETMADVCGIVAAHFPSITFTGKRTASTPEVYFAAKYANGYGKPGGNPLVNWLERVGMRGQRDVTKTVPDLVYRAGCQGAAEFLAGYLATDGCVKHRSKNGRASWDVHFDSVSRSLLEGVHYLLTRLGIVSCLNKGYRSAKGTMPIYRLSLSQAADNLRRFAEAVPARGRKGRLIQEMAAALAVRRTNPGLFALPAEVSEYVATLPEAARLWRHQGKRMRRDVCASLAERLRDERLRVFAGGDLLWEAVRSIEDAGEQEVFDICVPGPGNFLGNGIVAHNSGAIEQDADVVGFIYRPAYYERKDAVSQEAEDKAEEARRPGEYDGEEAEVIIAKQRNGPTGTVKLSFLPKYARFDNLAADRRDEPGTGF